MILNILLALILSNFAFAEPQLEELDKNLPCQEALSKPSDDLADDITSEYHDVSVSKNDQIKSIVDEFRRIRNPFSYYYSDEEKALAIELVIIFDGNVTAAARELEPVHAVTVRQWVRDYEKRHNVEIRNTKNYAGLKSYTKQEKEDAILMVIEEGGNVRATARKLNISQATLRGWVIEYEKKHGVQIRSIRRSNKRYFDEEKEKAILLVQQLDGNVDAAARKLDIIRETLRRWVIEHEEEHDVQIRNTKN